MQGIQLRVGGWVREGEKDCLQGIFYRDFPAYQVERIRNIGVQKYVFSNEKVISRFGK